MLVWYLNAGNIMAVFKNKKTRQACKKMGLKSSLNSDIKKWKDLPYSKNQVLAGYHETIFFIKKFIIIKLYKVN